MYRIALFVLLGALGARAADTTTVVDRDGHRARIDAAIAAGDYQAWKAEHDAWGGRGRMADRVTADNFATYAKMRQAMKEGNAAEASRVREELGFPAGAGKGGAGCARQAGGGRGDGAGAGRGGHGGHGKGGCGRRGN